MFLTHQYGVVSLFQNPLTSLGLFEKNIFMLVTQFSAFLSSFGMHSWSGLVRIGFRSHRSFIITVVENRPFNVDFIFGKKIKDSWEKIERIRLLEGKCCFKSSVSVLRHVTYIDVYEIKKNRKKEHSSKKKKKN